MFECTLHQFSENENRKFEPLGGSSDSAQVSYWFQMETETEIVVLCNVHEDQQFGMKTNPDWKPE